MAFLEFNLLLLLCNSCEKGGYTRAVYGQRIVKHIPANTNATEELFSMWSGQRYCGGLLKALLGNSSVVTFQHTSHAAEPSPKIGQP
jgi:hypothetical protein